MEMKTRRTTKILAAFLATILFISSGIVQSNVYVAQAAGKKSQVVETQAQLTKALKNANLTKLVIQTKKSKKFSIPKGKYQNVTLIVKAPDSNVTNRGAFKSITVTSMNKGSYTEAALPITLRPAADADKGGYTRGEWVLLLSKKLGFLLEGDVQEDLYYFSDT